MLTNIITVLLGAASLSPTLPHRFEQISRMVMGKGQPGCLSYYPDGQTGPCFPSVSVQKGNNVNGFSSGRQILISEATVTRLNEDEFALIIGHEIAHIYLGHTEQTVRNELNADWLGAELACNAGFDLGRGVKVFRFLRKSRVHPHYRERQDLLASLITRCGNSRSAI